MSDRIAIFCTSHLQSNKERYQNWLNYYTEYFKNEIDDIDFYMFNDGETEIELNGNVNIIKIWNNLGRNSIWEFPGWKRSFSTALNQLKNYKYIIHIEADLYLFPKTYSKFVDFMKRDGYFCGFDTKYKFPETSIQILNDKKSINWFINRYVDYGDWNENVDFEDIIKRELNPNIFLVGYRNENSDIQKEFLDYEYLAQTSLSIFNNILKENY